MEFNLIQIKSFIKKDFLIEHGTKSRVAYEILSVFLRLLFIYLISNFFREGAIFQNNSSYFHYILIGFCFLDIGSYVIMSVSKSIMAFKTDGTFEEILQAPLKPHKLMVLTVAYSLLFSFSKMIFYLVFAFIIDGSIFSSFEVIIKIILLTLLYIFSCIGISLAIGALTLIYFSPVRFLAVYSVLSMVLSGIFFPLSQFPVFINCFSYLLPIRAANDIGRSLINQSVIEMDLIFLLVCEVLVFYYVGYLALKHALIVAKKKGTLLYY